MSSDWFLSIILPKFDRAQAATREVEEYWDLAASRLEQRAGFGGSLFACPKTVLTELQAVRSQLDAAIARLESALPEWPTEDDRASLRVAAQAARKEEAARPKRSKKAQVEAQSASTH